MSEGIAEQIFRAIDTRATEALARLCEQAAPEGIFRSEHYGNTPLIECCRQNWPEGVNILADAGVDLEEENARGFPALIVACLNIERHADNRTALSLIEAGADPNHANWLGTTALAYAANFDDLQVVERLLAAGAEPNTPDSYGHLPIYYAVTSGNRSMTRALMKAGARMEAMSPTDYAACRKAQRSQNSPGAEAT